MMKTYPLPSPLDAMLSDKLKSIVEVVPQKLLAEKCAAVVNNPDGEKTLIKNTVEKMLVTSLRPDTVKIAAHEDSERDYRECLIAVVYLKEIAGNELSFSVTRLQSLIHQAIPYPLLLCLKEKNAEVLHLSTQPLRIVAQDPAKRKVAAARSLFSVRLPEFPSAARDCFLFFPSKNSDLMKVYEQWMCAILALKLVYERSVPFLEGRSLLFNPCTSWKKAKGLDEEVQRYLKEYNDAVAACRADGDDMDARHRRKEVRIEFTNLLKLYNLYPNS